MTGLNAHPITESSLRKLSESKNEPEWLLNKRVEALRAFDAMSMPDPLDEEWRRTDISGLDLEAALQITGDATVSRKVDALPAGVYFGELTGGEQEQAVRERLGTLVRPTEWKLGALEAALWREGTLVYVPRNVVVEEPLELTIEGTGAPLASHVVVIAEENSAVTLARTSKSEDGGAQSLALDAVEIFAAPGAQVSFIDEQSWGGGVYSFSTVRARLERGAKLTAATLGLGGRLVKTKLEVELAEQGAECELFGLTLGNEKQHFDYQTLQDHIAPRTLSNLMFKAALTDSASEVWYGKVRIRKGAEQSEASQTSRNLLLSEHAKAAPIPVLEIEEHNVMRATHGATAGPVDEEQRFYLESRGVEPAEAERLLVDAFFVEVIDKMPLGKLRERIEAAVTAKLEGVH